MSTVVLGNRNAVHKVSAVVKDDKGKDVVGSKFADLSGKQATVVEIPDDTPLAEALTNITHGEGVWANHSSNKQAYAPAWVASDSPGLALVLAEHFGGIEVRELADPFDPETAKGKQKVVQPARKKAVGGGTTFLTTAMTYLFVALFVARLMPMLKTNAGNDVQAAQMSGGASATAVLKWVALTANTTTPVVGDTTLTAEIVTGGGGLIRKAGTYAHTTSAASYTITTTFTANGSDSLPVTIGKRGIFDAASAGNMGFSTLVSPTATLSASGDSLTLTDTITL